MFGIGMPEMILILAVALIVIGPKKLPDLAKSLGRALGEFKKATQDLKDSFEVDEDINDVKTSLTDFRDDVTSSITNAVTDELQSEDFAEKEQNASSNTVVKDEKGKDKR